MTNTFKLFMLRSLNNFVQLFLGYQLGQRFPFLKRIYSLAYDSLRPARVKVFDQWLTLHPDDRVFSKEVLSKGVFEKFETQLFLSSLEEGMTVFDIGANVGYYTLIAAQKVGSSGHVYAFEPDKENFKILQKNVLSNNHSNVTLMDYALSDKDGYLELYLSPDNKGDHRTYKTPEPQEKRDFYKVRAISIDSLFSSAGTYPSVIKMDIQGFEFFALTGMQALITRTPNLVLYTEFWPYGLTASGLDSPVRYYSILKNLGFDIFNIDDSKETLSRVLNIDELLDSLPEESFTNFLCLKGSWSNLRKFTRSGLN